jgi:DNA polymerase
MSAGDAQARLDAVAAEVRAHHRSGCGFEPCETATQMVPGEGPASARVALVGEAPGQTEDRTGRPFAGRAGALLDKLLAMAELRREDVYVTNVVKARPPGNRDPRRTEIAHHLPWLEHELELVAPEIVVALGRHALSILAPGEKITEAHGRLLHHGARHVFALHHPAAALRVPALRATLMEDAVALRDVLAGERERVSR